MPDQGSHLTAFSPLAIATITPATGQASGATNLTIHGVGFGAGTTVRFGGSAPTIVVIVDTTTITATVLAHAPGPVNVTVMNSDGTVATLPGGFTFASAVVPTPSPPVDPVGPPTPPGHSGGIPPLIPTAVPGPVTTAPGSDTPLSP